MKVYGTPFLLSRKHFFVLCYVNINPLIPCKYHNVVSRFNGFTNDVSQVSFSRPMNWQQSFSLNCNNCVPTCWWVWFIDWPILFFKQFILLFVFQVCFHKNVQEFFSVVLYFTFCNWVAKWVFIYHWTIIRKYKSTSSMLSIFALVLKNSIPRRLKNYNQNWLKNYPSYRVNK